jgi:hypothetical protein
MEGTKSSAEMMDNFTAKLTLVDLAGSERIKKTNAHGNQRQEGIRLTTHWLVYLLVSFSSIVQHVLGLISSFPFFLFFLNNCGMISASTRDCLFSAESIGKILQIAKVEESSGCDDTQLFLQPE